VRRGINRNRKIFAQKAQVILETILALTMLVLFLMGAMAILKSTNQ
jgi:uncharacterized protein (UPF0333 family)